MDYEIRAVYGHYEIYIDNKFVCSADTFLEAKMEIAELKGDM